MMCLNCGQGELHPAKIQHEVNVGRERFVGTLDGERCGACRDTTIALDALVRFERAVAERIAARGPVSGATMRCMRKVIPLSAARLADLLHVAPETISRWETGEREVDRAAWLVVRELLLDPGAQASIAELSDEPSVRPVRIEVHGRARRVSDSPAR